MAAADCHQRRLLPASSVCPDPGQAFRKAGEPKWLEILPCDVVGLYIEPGLRDDGIAVEWFDRYLRDRSRITPMSSKLEH